MSTLHDKFTDHPNSVGENYLQHFASASFFASRMLLGSVVCALHALFPFLFVKTGSRLIEELYQRMVCARHRQLGAQNDDQDLQRSVKVEPQTL